MSRVTKALIDEALILQQKLDELKANVVRMTEVLEKTTADNGP